MIPCFRIAQDGTTTLMCALMKGASIEVVELLVDKGSDIKASQTKVPPFNSWLSLYRAGAK
jgi:ankyrin repeat protein